MRKKNSVKSHSELHALISADPWAPNAEALLQRIAENDAITAHDIATFCRHESNAAYDWALNFGRKEDLYWDLPGDPLWDQNLALIPLMWKKRHPNCPRLEHARFVIDTALKLITKFEIEGRSKSDSVADLVDENVVNPLLGIMARELKSSEVLLLFSYLNSKYKEFSFELRPLLAMVGGKGGGLVKICRDAIDDNSEGGYRDMVMRELKVLYDLIVCCEE
jgi:hypothetical protein